MQHVIRYYDDNLLSSKPDVLKSQKNNDYNDESNDQVQQTNILEEFHTFKSSVQEGMEKSSLLRS